MGRRAALPRARRLPLSFPLIQPLEGGERASGSGVSACAEFPRARTPLPVLLTNGKTGFFVAAISGSALVMAARRAVRPPARTLHILVLAALCAACSDRPADQPARSGESAVPATRSATGPVEATDDAGRIIRLNEPARRIISLIPSITETLVAMGAEGLLVARTDFDEATVAHLPSVGGGLTPSLELIASLQPDLVVVWEEAGGARIRPRLEALGIPVFAAQTRDTADIFANIEAIGALSGMKPSADSLATWIRNEFDSIRASVQGREEPRVLYLVGLDPPIVAGPNLYIGEALRVAGGANVFADVVEASPQMSLEEVVRRRPEIVLVPSSGTGTATIERLVASPGWAELHNSGSTRFHALSADLMHRPGPSVAEAAWLLSDAIHPELAGSR